MLCIIEGTLLWLLLFTFQCSSKQHKCDTCPKSKQTKKAWIVNASWLLPGVLTLLVRVVWLMWSGKWSGLDQFSKWTGKLFYPFLDHAATWLVRSITHQISQEKIFIIQDTSHSIAWIDNSSLNSEVFQFVQYKMAVLADGVEQFTSFVAWAGFKFASHYSRKLWFSSRQGDNLQKTLILPLFVFSLKHPKQNARSLLTPVSGTVFMPFHMVALVLFSMVAFLTIFLLADNPQ